MRLIDADELNKDLDLYDRDVCGFCGNEFAAGFEAARELIADAPTIDVEPVRHGEREHVTVWHSAAWGELYTVYKCCGFRERRKTWHNYCPNCGAKMDEEVQE